MSKKNCRKSDTLQTHPVHLKTNFLSKLSSKVTHDTEQGLTKCKLLSIKNKIVIQKSRIYLSI